MRALVWLSSFPSAVSSLIWVQSMVHFCSFELLLVSGTGNADEPDLFQIASPMKAGKTDMLPHVGSVPEGEMTVNHLADLVGRTRHINTIDVSTQV